MGELARMLDTYRRLGFEKLSEQERQVLTELLLGAVVEMQEGLREIKEGVKALTGLSDEVAAQKAWKEAVEDELHHVLHDRRQYQEGVNRTKWGLVEKAAAVIAALVGLGILYLIAQEVRSAPVPRGVEVHGARPGPVGPPRDLQRQQQGGEEEEPAGGAFPPWLIGGRGRYLAAVHPQDELRLAAQHLGGLAVQAPFARPPFGGVHEAQAFYGITERRGPRHPAERSGGGRIRQQASVGEQFGVGPDGADGVPSEPAGIGAASEQVRRGGVGVGETPSLEETVMHGVEVPDGIGVGTGEPPSGGAVRLDVPLGFYQVAYGHDAFAQALVGGARGRGLLASAEAQSENHG